MFLPKDFIETDEGYIFAVVAHGIEQCKVLCFLRYIKIDDSWVKVDTEQANALLKDQCPNYLYFSALLDAELHAVTIDKIVRRYQPRERLQQILNKRQYDEIEYDLIQLCNLLQENGVDLSQIGITGSLLVGVQKQSSDIDLICYGRDTFHQCRAMVTKLIKQHKLQDLTEEEWVSSYNRRSCHLSFSEYVWHERRKANKALINGRKIDLNFIDDIPYAETMSYQKCGMITLQCLVIDDTYAFDYPAVFKVSHEEYDAIVCFTATYTGQAIAGETIEVTGKIEQTSAGLKRILVGSSREAVGEYIKVIHA
jgi:predicted nucleotidyltransferase